VRVVGTLVLQVVGWVFSVFALVLLSAPDSRGQELEARALATRSGS
jgi:hypothetical protein